MRAWPIISTRTHTYPQLAFQTHPRYGLAEQCFAYRYPIQHNQENKRRQRLQEQLDEMGLESFTNKHGVNLETLRGRVLLSPQYTGAFPCNP